jgi:LysM repeat protein
MTAVPPVAPEGATALEEIPDIDQMTDGVPLELPPMDVASDAAPGGAAPAWTPPAAGSASNAPSGLPSFDTPLSPEIPGVGAPGAEHAIPPIESAAPVSTEGFAPPADFTSSPDFAPPADAAASFDPAPSAGPGATAALAESAGAAAFAAAMDQAKQLLDQNQLAQALAHLSAMHKSTQLTPAERAQLNELLDQVAGTVIYSREHRLLGAHIVAANESLESIAAHYQVPAGLLAKINGIADPNMLKPGDELKVVEGPFHAVVDLEEQELTLMLDDNYAGRFPISAAPGATAAEGSYVVEDKPGFHNLQLTPQAAGAPGVGTVLIGANDPRVALKLSPRDAEDVSSILSTGSQVVIRR